MIKGRFQNDITILHVNEWINHSINQIKYQNAWGKTDKTEIRKTEIHSYNQRQL